MSKEGRFQVASGAVDVSFRKNPEILRTDTVFVSHVLVDFGEALSTAGAVELVYNADAEGFKDIKVAEKNVDVGADHATFDFATPLAVNGASLNVLFANTDDVAVRIVFIHSYR